MTINYKSNDFNPNVQMPQQNQFPTQQGNMPQGNMPRPDNNFPGNMMPQNGMRPEMGQPMSNQQVKQLSNLQITLLVVESILLSLCMIYLIMSKFNLLTLQETFVNKDKIIICILSVILLSEGIFGGSLLFSNFNKNQNQYYEEENEDYEDIDGGKIVDETVIDLSQYNQNITLKESKTYTLTGNLNHSVLIDANGPVTIKLNNVTINSHSTAAIANINSNDFTVYLEEGSINRLSDGGYSEYDGCLYSNGTLTIEGNGTLYVNGQQKEGEGIATTDKDIIINGGNIYVESADDGLNAGGDIGGMITINAGVVYIHASGDGIDSNGGLTINGGVVYSMGSAAGGDAGIDTDGGYSIHGGTVIGLGSDMLTPPANHSKQKSISLNLNQVIQAGTDVTILNSKDEVVIAFVADENFRTLVFSSESLASGTYSIYINGTHTGEKITSIYQNTSYTKGEKIMDIEL